MAVTAIFASITLLLPCASAGNITTPFLLPNALFWDGPSPQTFVGEVTTKGPTTYYTLNCGDDDTPFYPGTGGCDENNSYTFSADVATTQFLVRTTDFIFSGHLQNFNQTLTINCGTTDSNSVALCGYTSLFNEENTKDASIISSTLTLRSSTEIDSSLYPIIFTNVHNSAPSAGSTPSNSMPAATTTTASTAASSTAPAAAASTSFTKVPSKPTSIAAPPPSPPHLSPGAKAGIGIGVSLGTLLLCALVFLLYRSWNKRKHARRNHAGGFVPPGSFAGEVETKEEVVADTSGVHEMEGRKTPVNGGMYEMEGS